MKRSWFNLVALVTVIGGGLLLSFLLKTKGQSFPALPPGTYVGQISGLGSNLDTRYALYLERMSGARAILVVVFKEGWKPQIVQVQHRLLPEHEKSEVRTADIVLEPIALVHADQQFNLIGTDAFQGYGGDVSSSSGVLGSWSLEPISADVLSENVSGMARNDGDFERWLILKAEFLDVQVEQQRLAEALEKERAENNKLTEFVERGDELRERAELRRTALRTQLEQLKAERAASSSAVTKLVSELKTLGRITKRGRVVDLARRVSAREEKWYRANWRAEEDASVLEEFGAENTRIDLGELNAQHEIAAERQRLEQEAAAERQRIQELEARTKQGSGKQRRRDSRDASGKPSFWDRLWGRIK